MDHLSIYKNVMRAGTPVLKTLLRYRVSKGKEDPRRLDERKGIASINRPSGPVMWFHVASVGEAQSILSLISIVLAQNSQLHVLVTSVTRTSAALLADRLPDRAFHQYAPVDHPAWVRRFLDHWQPNLAIWVESELWPSMLSLVKKRRIPAALLNAHMSPSSHKNWKRAPDLARNLLSAFLVIQAQSRDDGAFYRDLDAASVVVTDNIKYAAKPLEYDANLHHDMQTAIGSRPLWLYASSHAGEESLACDVHSALAARFPDLLTIIAPRHPERRNEIAETMRDKNLSFRFRGEDKVLPQTTDAVYVADTMGEMGLFYKLAPLAVVGRSFSDDGGGGHNPIEPALLDCAVLHGPMVQNSTALYREMDDAGAALEITLPAALPDTIAGLLDNAGELDALRKKGYEFAQAKAGVMEKILEELEPLFLEAHLPAPRILS